jgi:hypothetical protein
MIVKLRVSCNGSQTTLDCDALAVAGHNALLASVAGPASTIKALAAILQTKAKLDLQAEYENGTEYYDAWPGTWRCFKSRLAFHTWHMLAIADCDGLMLDSGESALWRELRGDRYTTPLLRSWMPQLAETFRDNGMLTVLGGFGHKAALLRLKGDDLDNAVSEAIRVGRLVLA